MAATVSSATLMQSLMLNEWRLGIRLVHRPESVISLHPVCVCVCIRGEGFRQTHERHVCIVRLKVMPIILMMMIADFVCAREFRVSGKACSQSVRQFLHNTRDCYLLGAPHGP